MLKQQRNDTKINARKYEKKRYKKNLYYIKL